MSALLTVSDIVNPQAPVLTADASLPVAIDMLLKNQINGAAVCDSEGNLQGFFSAHDVMVEMWCQDYIPDQDVTVGSLMKTDVVSIKANDRLTDVMEFLALDKEQLYPTTSMGYATRLTTLSVEERAKSIKVNRPQILPVVDAGKYVGTVSRKEVLAGLRTLFTDSVSPPVEQTTASSIASPVA
ncbi:CBS domain-containing protein [Vibrio sp. SCSIO 43135]|uniref:CBS domain-containing protein n=1 Tax=Vibrio paucivorans TaxID=2829489 RepID=A0A9X3CGU0_9VIBR|nr:MULTISPECIES: CBS domain-containing protein [Vibrio]MCW8335599.1 CBS domain-containing protein [Vibrio paucivorans]USD43988.1 CBS domain-containing protein [Vibrio sp. SCSIO 43135]